MERFFWTIVRMGAEAIPVIGAVCLLRYGLQRAPKKFSYALWAVVGIRLLCPVLLPSVFSVFNLPIFQRTETAVRLEGELTSTFFSKEDWIREGNTGTTAWSGENTESFSSAFDWENLLVWIWITGVCLCLCYLIFSYRRVKKNVRQAILWKDSVYYLGGLPSPFVMGILSPKIYLPYLPAEEEEDLVLLHERCHIRRKDHLIKFFGWLLVSLYWFHPLVWLSYFLMAKDMEMSCDEWVITKAGAERKKEYSQRLLKFAVCKETTLGGSILGFGENETKKRIQNILEFRKISGKKSLVLSMLIWAAVVAFGTTGAARSDEEEESGNEAYLLPSDQIQELYELRTPYVGDASSLGALLGKMKETGLLPNVPYTMEIQSETTPYGLTVSFEDVGERMTEKELSRSGTVLLALVGNLSEVTFSYGDEAEEQYFSWTEEMAEEENAVEEIKECAESVETFSELFSGEKVSDVTIIGGADGPTSIFLAKSFYREDLEEMLEYAVQEYLGALIREENSYLVCSAKILKQESKDDQTTVYLSGLAESYEITEEALISDTCKVWAHAPAKVTLEKNEKGEYKVQDFWMPEKEETYEEEIRRQFPEELWEEALHLEEQLEKQKEECTEKVKELNEMIREMR